MILIDTCVISEVAKAAPDAAVSAWFSSVPDADLRLSVLTLGEIQKGVDLLPRSARKERIEGWLSELRGTFADRILPIDQEVALQWGSVSARLRRLGAPSPPIDTLLAATALRHGLTLATRNVADFKATGIKLVNPWATPR